MERFCDECGSLVNGNVEFCPVCGAFMKSAVDLGKSAPDIPARPAAPTQTGFGFGSPSGSGVGQNAGYGAPQYGQNITQSTSATEVMSMGQWVGIIIACTFLGIVSLILNIIWGFSNTTPEPRRSYCRAMIVINILSYLLAFGLLGLLISAF
ncbi:MAG: hypothetical protein K2J80_11805 [Oscillospiraceae bacterium]|nr:hypothetical protein [Oscillospiraceae bacterium]